MDYWPSTLQSLPNQDYSQEIIDGVIRSQNDVGASQARPRFTRTRMKSTLTIWVTSAQYTTFMDFYNTTIAQGSLPFYWTNPITGVQNTVKFLAPPKINAVNSIRWSVQCQLEEQ
jgi:hypothetical protein